MDFLIETVHEVLGEFKIPYMGTDHNPRRIIFCELADVFNPVEFIGESIFQTGGNGYFVDYGLPENEIIAIGIQDALNNTLVMPFSEIIVNDFGLFPVEKKVIKGNECQQKVCGIEPEIPNQKDKYLVTGNSPF